MLLLIKLLRGLQLTQRSSPQHTVGVPELHSCSHNIAAAGNCCEPTYGCSCCCVPHHLSIPGGMVMCQLAKGVPAQLLHALRSSHTKRPLLPSPPLLPNLWLPVTPGVLVIGGTPFNTPPPQYGVTAQLLHQQHGLATDTNWCARTAGSAHLICLLFY